MGIRNGVAVVGDGVAAHGIFRNGVVDGIPVLVFFGEVCEGVFPAVIFRDFGGRGFSVVGFEADCNALRSHMVAVVIVIPGLGDGDGYRLGCGIGSRCGGR